MIYTARVLDGEQAAKIGLVNHVVEQNSTSDAAYHRSLELAEEIIPHVSCAMFIDVHFFMISENTLFILVHLYYFYRDRLLFAWLKPPLIEEVMYA